MPIGRQFASPQKFENVAFDLQGFLLHPQIFRRLFAPVRDDVERNLVALAQVVKPGPLDGRDVNEHVLASTAVRLDEAITLGCVKPLHCASRHVRTPL